jgi:hypothetical protein
MAKARLRVLRKQAAGHGHEAAKRTQQELKLLKKGAASATSISDYLIFNRLRKLRHQHGQPQVPQVWPLQRSCLLQKECQVAHWKSGHRAACTWAGGKLCVRILYVYKQRNLCRTYLTSKIEL